MIDECFTCNLLDRLPRTNPSASQSSTCSEDLTVEALHGHHGDGDVLKKANQAEITVVLQLDALLVALRDSLAFEKLEQNLPKPRKVTRVKVCSWNRGKRTDEGLLVGGPHPEDSLPDLVPEAGREQQAVELLRPPVQQRRLHLLARRAAPQQLVQDVQSLHHLRENMHQGGNVSQRLPKKMRNKASLERPQRV